ncbi:hypothetical protein ACSS6W_000291 [Trichoderma asperelloides]
MANLRIILLVLASAMAAVKGLEEVAMTTGAVTGLALSAPIGYFRFIRGPNTYPIYPLDRVERGEQPDGTYRLWLSSPASLFQAGNQLIVRSPAANGQDQCGPVNTIITTVGCHEINTAADIVLQLCVDPENCGVSS